MKELKDILLELIRGITPKQAYTLLLVAVIFAGVYFVSDRILSHIEFNMYVNEIKTFKESVNDLSGRINLIEKLVTNRPSPSDTYFKQLIEEVINE